MEKKVATAVYIPKQLFELTEETRRKLGMNRSKFVQYCLMKTLQDLSVLTAQVHKETDKNGRQ